MKDMYEDAARAVLPDGTYDLSRVDLSKVPKISEIMELKNTRFPSRLKNVGLAEHHGVRKDLLKMLIAQKNPTWTVAAIEAEYLRLESTMPGVLVHELDHVGRAGQGIEQGEAAFEQLLARAGRNGGQGLPPLKWLPDSPMAVPSNTPYSAGQILEGLRLGYEGWGRPEVGAAVFKWLEVNQLLP